MPRSGTDQGAHLEDESIPLTPVHGPPMPITRLRSALPPKRLYASAVTYNEERDSERIDKQVRTGPVNRPGSGFPDNCQGRVLRSLNPTQLSGEHSLTDGRVRP